MSHVPVGITWSGSSAAAHPDKAVITLSLGQDSVQWTSAGNFIINIQGNKIHAAQQGGQWVAESPRYTSPQKIAYAITPPTGGPGDDPEIEIQT